MEIQDARYFCEGEEHFGKFIKPEGSNLPVVLVAHDWSGLNDFALGAARRMAEKGYLGFALDVFGEGKNGSTNEEKTALIQPLMQDRGLLRKRLLAGLEKACSLDGVNPKKVAVIGFCFGGLCAFDLARSGAELKGAVGFHALLDPPGIPTQKIKASVLALHGHDDPMVPPEKVLAFEKEMTASDADWQLLAYGHTVHAFTNPRAKDPSLGTVYNERTASRAWQVALHFLEEILG